MLDHTIIRVIREIKADGLRDMQHIGISVVQHETILKLTIKGVHIGHIDPEDDDSLMALGELNCTNYDPGLPSEICKTEVIQFKKIGVAPQARGHG